MTEGLFNQGPLPLLKGALDETASRHVRLARDLVRAGLPDPGGFQATVERARLADGEGGPGSHPAPLPERSAESLMADLGRNSLRHQALLRVLSGRYQALQTVIREGR